VVIFRKNLLLDGLYYFDKILKKYSESPEELFEENLLSKTLVLKMDNHSYLFVFIYPYEEYEQVKHYVNSHMTLKKIIEETRKEMSDEGIFDKIELDSVFFSKSFTISKETSNPMLENIDLFTIDDDVDFDNFKSLFNEELLRVESTLQKLMSVRRSLRHQGKRSPVAAFSAETYKAKRIIYADLMSKVDSSITLNELRPVS